MLSALRRVLFAFHLLVVNGCQTEAVQFRVSGQLGADRIDTRVDSAMARDYLRVLMGEGLERSASARLQETLARFDNAAVTNETLAAVARTTSTDFAALYFAQRSTSENVLLKSQFTAYTATAYAASAAPLPESLTAGFVVVFVPGLFYRSHPETKGDLVDAERVVRSLGLRTSRVNTLDAGTVEENAAIVANFIQNYDNRDAQLIVVSASKGGPEVLLALSSLAAEDQRRVVAWVSIGGALRGSPVADEWLNPPKSWVARLLLRSMGASPQMVESLGTQRSAERLAQAAPKLPSHLLVLHYVGVPLSGTVTDAVRAQYTTLSKLGPNDGITLLCDEVLPNGLVLVDLGLDHRFADARIAEKTAALARITVELSTGQLPPPRVERH